MRLSIIIPVYNASATLNNCLRSVLQATVQDLEVICVDDGSKDNSQALLETLAANDSRIRVFSQKNAGASAARNAALAHAQGDYILFVDADDEVEPDYFENLLKLAGQYGATCVVSGWSVKEGNLPIKRYPQPEAVFDSPRPVDLAGMQPGVSGHLYARSVLQKSRALFPAGIRFGEDTAFHYAQFPFCPVYVQSALTGYIVHRTPGSASAYSGESVVDMVEATAWLARHYQQHGWPDGALDCLLHYAAHAWRRICSMAPHKMVVASAGKLATVLRNTPAQAESFSVLKRKDARALSSLYLGGCGLNLSYYWKRMRKRLKLFLHG